jgi:Protein of unknown function (DUF3631)
MTAPWGDMNGLGRELTHRGLAQRLSNYQIKPKQIRIGFSTMKGYTREDMQDAWLRYLGVPDVSNQNHQSQTINTEDVIKVPEPEPVLSRPPYESETSETRETDEKFYTCRTEGCTAGLWAQESQLLGYCARCRKDDATRKAT